jgi:hypothetical protein
VDYAGLAQVSFQDKFLILGSFIIFTLTDLLHGAAYSLQR